MKLTSYGVSLSTSSTSALQFLVSTILLAACSASQGDVPVSLRETITPMAYDSARGVTVLCGRFDRGQDETWEWDGSTWTQRATTGPTPREGHALAYDSVRGVTVLFGGFEGAGVSSGETWEWDGSTWTKRAPSSGPSPRYGHAMTFDSTRNVVLLFGGQDGALDAETWEWDGNTGRWALRASNGPSPRSRHALVYDSARNVSVLFGGQDVGGADGSSDSETWEWDGRTRRWTQVASGGPSPRALHAMVYDSTRAATVLFGGFDVGYAGETWEWDGTTWTQRTPLTGSLPEPSPRASHGMAYDSARGVAVLFGGFDGTYEHDTWEWDGAAWTQRPTTEALLRGRALHVHGFGIIEGSSSPRSLVYDLQAGPAGARAVWLEKDL